MKPWEQMTQAERDEFVDDLPSHDSLRVRTLRTEHLETMPPDALMEYGVIYVSLKFELAIHLCACGWCNNQTVTPFRDATSGWTYSEENGNVTLSPSIGNWNMQCHSHYYVRNGKIEWLSGLDCFGNEEGTN